MKKYNICTEVSQSKVNEPAIASESYPSNDTGVFALMHTARKGISFIHFDTLMKKFPFTVQNWAKFLHISSKTLSRYQKEKKTFDALQSEKILQIELLYTRGREVFGSDENFMIWLQSENLALGKLKPKDILDSSFGISLLMDELTRIEHGILAQEMIVYRLSKEIYANDLSGKGAEIAGGRWNSKGVAMVYTGQSIALCVAEIAVHMPLGILPVDYCLVHIEIPENSVLEIKKMPSNWNVFPYSNNTQKLGDKFIFDGKKPVLKVPSAAVQGEFNFLLNPRHPDFYNIKIKKVEKFSFDKRLFIK